MANQRLRLRCRVCKIVFLLAKFDPISGWYAREPERLGSDLNRWLTEHDHGLRNLWSNYQFGVSYEVPGRFDGH